MDLTESTLPACVRRTGLERDIIVTAPGQLRIQTTGAGSGTVLMSGPPAGRKWAVTLRVEITETDA